MLRKTRGLRNFNYKEIVYLGIDFGPNNTITTFKSGIYLEMSGSTPMMRLNAIILLHYNNAWGNHAKEDSWTEEIQLEGNHLFEH